MRRLSYSNLSGQISKIIKKKNFPKEKKGKNVKELGLIGAAGGRRGLCLALLMLSLESVQPSHLGISSSFLS